jgi:hypothetical protein
MTRSPAFVLVVLAIVGAWGSGPRGNNVGLVKGEQIMDGADSGAAQARGPRVRRSSLPEIVSLTFEHVKVEPRSYKFVRSVQDDAREALAFVITVKGELRLDMNATPVLYVGDVELSQGESLGDGRYRFLAFPSEQKRMRAGAPISLGWPGHKPHQQTRFRYEPDRR